MMNLSTPESILAIAIAFLVGGFIIDQYRRCQSRTSAGDSLKAQQMAAAMSKTWSATVAELKDQIAQQGASLDEEIAKRREQEEHYTTLERSFRKLQEAYYDLRTWIAERYDGEDMPPDVFADDPPIVQTQVNVKQLKKKITEQFNLDELQDLALRIGVNPDELAGETLSVRASELISYAKRRGLLSDLVVVCRDLRPNWDKQY